MALEFPKSFGNYVLKGMEEISSPDPISAMPQGVGWWVLTSILLLVGGFLFYRLRRSWIANAYRRRASAALLTLEEGADENWHDHLQGLPEILRATALKAYPRRNVVALSGARWREFLNATTDSALWSEKTFQTLYDLSYRPASKKGLSEVAAREVLHVTKEWVETHQSNKKVGAILGGENV